MTATDPRPELAAKPAARLAPTAGAVAAQPGGGGSAVSGVWTPRLGLG